MIKPDSYPRWATILELDPVTNTPNKTQPSLEFQNSGLKREEPLFRDHLNWQLNLISNWVEFFDNNLSAIQSDTTIYVSVTGNDTTGTGDILTPFATPHRAIQSLEGVPIADDTTVTIFCSSGTYNFTTPIVVKHPYGDKVQIVGDSLLGNKPTGVGAVDWSVDKLNPVVTPRTADQWYNTAGELGTDAVTGDRYTAIANDLANNKTLAEERINTVFKFTDSSGISLESGGSLGLLDKIHLQGDWDGVQGNEDNYHGIVSGSTDDLQNNNLPINATSASIRVGKDTIILGFKGDGIRAGYNSNVVVEQEATISNNGNIGINLYNGTTVSCDQLNCLGNGNKGIFCSEGAVLKSITDIISGNINAGVESELSQVNLNSTKLLGNGSAGANGSKGDFLINALDCRGNGRDGITLESNSTLISTGSSINDNQVSGVHCDASDYTGDTDNIQRNETYGIGALHNSTVKVTDNTLQDNVGVEVYADRMSFVRVINPTLPSGSGVTAEKNSYVSIPDLVGVVYTPAHGTVAADGATIND